MTTFKSTGLLLCSLVIAVSAVRVQQQQQAKPTRDSNSRASSDQAASASTWWQQPITGGTHSVLQSHPSLSSIPTSRFPSSAARAPSSASLRAPTPTGGFPSFANPNPKSPFRHLDYTSSATAELRRNPNLSAPDECARACREGEPPRICYYHFTLEYYTVLGAACQVCTPNATNTVWSHCQCVLADGVERGILTANRMIPGPSIQVCENDRVVIDVENHMEGMEVTLHWHGIWQRGTQYYDGVAFVTQCPIQQGNTFRYQWTANSGTHFWHAHTGLQKLDGLHGSLVVRQPPSRDPNSHLYDFDLTTHVIVLSDWLHEDAAERYPGRLAVNTGQDPESLLINGKGQFRDPNTGFMTNTPLEVFTMTPGKRYRFRMITAFSSVCPAQLTIEGHTLTVIATDGEPVHPVNVNTIISFSGERYDFVIHADQPVGAYWIQLRGLGECGIKRTQQLAILRYARGPYQPATPAPTYDVGIPQGVVMNPLDAQCDQPRQDAICVNQLKDASKRTVQDPALLQDKPDVKIFLPFRFYLYRPEELFQPNTYNRFLVAPTGDHVISLIDEISYLSPPTPLLSQYDDINPEQFCNGDNRPASCGANCMCTHKVDIPLNAIVEVVLVDEVQQPNLSHPFHLHGHAFNVIGIGRSPDTTIKKINLKHALDLDRRGLLHRQYDLPPLKDTVAVPNNGYVVFRFRADNPGAWLFHCHFLFHITIGMNLILHVGTQADLPPVPPNFPTCGDHLVWFFHCHFLFHIPIGMNMILQVMNPLDAICDKKRNDAVCVSNLKNAKKVSEEILQERPDIKIFLPFRFYFYKIEELFRPQTYNRFLVPPGGDHLISLVDEISYVSPPAPILSQYDDIDPRQFCNGDNRPPDCGPNCMCTHKVDIPLNAIVEVVLVDEVQQDNLSHPFHLHGYAFNVIGMGRSPDTTIKKISLKHALELDRRGLLHRQFKGPPLKDTIAVPNNGYVVIRFKADNPGAWLFHCHFLFHIVIGMNLVIHVGTQADLPPVPPNFPTCGHHLPPIKLH